MSLQVNENDAYVFCVEQPVKWVFPPEHFWIGGWLVAKTEKRYTDVRAFIDEVPVMGLYGLPRPDIEALYPAWTHGRPAGFSFRLEPWRGARQIRLEILNEDKEWAEFWRVPIKVKGRGSCRRRQATLEPRLLLPLFLTLLKQPTLRPKLARPDLVRRLVREYSTIPLEVLPVPPLHGVFEGPHLIGHTQYHKLHLGGWVFHEHQPIRRLFATTDNTTRNHLNHGLARDDVVRLFPGNVHAQHCLFRGDVDLSGSLVEPVCLKIFAELANGEIHLCFSKRIFAWTSVEKEHPLPPYDPRNFADMVGSVRRACRELRVRPGGWHFWRAVLQARRLYRRESPEPRPWFAWQQLTPYQAWLARDALTPRLREALTVEARAGGPDFILVVNPPGADPAAVRRLAASVRAQFYQRWRLILIQTPEAPPAMRQVFSGLAAGDSRVTVHSAPDANLAGACNNAIDAATGDWICFLEPSGRLPENALLEIARAVSREPGLELVFTNEDRMKDDGTRLEPVFKGAWSRPLVFASHQPGRLLAVHRKLYFRAGAMHPHYPPALWFDLCLRLEEGVAPDRVRHVEAICHHGPWPAADCEPGSPLQEAMRHALDASFQRRGWAANAFQPAFARRRKFAWHQVYWNASYLAQNPVTIVIPARDRSDLLERCLEYLLLTVDWRHVQLLIVDDFSRDEKTLRMFGLLQARRDFRCRVIRPGTDSSRPFNYSRLMNAALPHLDTPLVLHLNNDVDARRPGWIEAMAGWFAASDVGAVGARLIFPDDRINHAGITVGPHDGLADVPLAGLQSGSDEFLVEHRLARDVAAVTGACLMTRTDLYRRLGGFNETEFGVSYNDVDYCLRLGAAGWRVLYEPQAELRHWGSASRGTAFHEQEHLAFVRKYSGFTDPWFPTHFRLGRATLQLDAYRFEHGPRAGSLHLLLVTHNLNFEGAPLFLLEYATFMVRRAGFKVDLLAAEDGPLRGAYEDLGIPVRFIDRHPFHAVHSELEFDAQVRHALAQLDLAAIDVVLCNTVACWWGVHLAAAAGKPSLLYVHESASIKRFFSSALRESMQGLARAAFRQATRVCLLCRATWAYYADLNDYDNFRLVSSWIDLPRIEEFKRRHTRAELRHRHGYAGDDVIIANIGTVCARKGQHVFIHAVDHFLRHFAGSARHRFLLVGGRAGEFLDGLTRDIAGLGLENIEIIPETRDVYDYFRLADLFACTSFEESFPRVLLEAMAFETPIVTTDVHGVVEMATDRAEAYLVKPGDAVEFSRIMKTCLDKEQNGISTTPLAFSKVVRAYHCDDVLPKHAAMAREAFLAYDDNTRRREPRKLSGGGDRFESTW